MSFGQAFRGLANESLGLFGLADHGTELNKSQSDRLMMTNMGNTTSITQRAVAPTTMGKSQSEKYRSALDMPASKETVAEKGYVIALGDWTTSQNAGTTLEELHVPSVFKSSDFAIFGLLNYHEYIRCGIDVTVQINPTEWQMGGLIVWIESCQDTKATLMTNYNNLLTYTSDILNCNVNDEVRLKQAFTFSRNMYELHQSSNQPQDIFCIRIAVWSKLSVASGTSTKVSYKVTASLCDVEMHGMRVKAQMMKGPSGYSPAGQMAIGPGIGAINMSNMDELHVNNHLTMGCEGFEMDASFAGGVECKNLDKHLTTPCRFATVKWSTTKSAGTQLVKWKVHPRQPANTYDTWAPPGAQSTNISLISSLYRYWRGDLIFVFQVFATKWHSGRLMVAFTPGMAEQITSSTTLKVVSTCSAAQYDIHGPQSTFVYRVPYISATQYMDCDPTKGFTGWVYAYVYTQMAAPNTVATEVEIVCYMCGADNFQLFVPSYNAVQMGPGDESKVPVKNSKDSGSAKSKGVVDVAAAAVVDHGSDTAKPQVFKESPMGAMEMPQYEPSKAGTFPELKEGTVLHKKRHTDLNVLLGRAHHWTSFLYTGSQTFINDQNLNWSKLTGILEAVSKCFTLFRGGLKVVVTIETLFQAEVYMCFRPKGVEALTTLEQMYKYGMVSFSTEQTHQVVLKLPWYQPLAANSVFAEYDANFGYLTMAAETSGTVKVHLAIAFDTDSRFYMPRGCPTDKHFKMGTVSSSFRMKRSLPNAVHDTTKTTDGTSVVDGVGKMKITPDEVDNDFLRGSVSRKGVYDSPAGDLAQSSTSLTGFERAARRLVGMKPEAKYGVFQRFGPYLCKRRSDKYPVDHYFILLSDGTQYAFQSENGEMYGNGVVAQEFHSEYDIVAPASDMCEVVKFMVGPYYRKYSFLTYNCEHWARSYCGLGERSTQTQRLLTFAGLSTLPVVGLVAAMRPQMINEVDPSASEEDEHMVILRADFVQGCLDRYEKDIKAGFELDGTLSEAAELAKYMFDNGLKDEPQPIGSGKMKEFVDMFAAALRVTNVQTKSKKNTDVVDSAEVEPKASNGNWFTRKMEQLTAKMAKKGVETVKEELTETVEKTQSELEKWLRNTIMPTLEAKGAKVAKKVLNIVIDVAQAACLLHVAINYPVPGVIGPIAAAGALGALRGATRLLYKLANRDNTAKPEMYDDLDVTAEMAGMIYEVIIRQIPSDMEPQMAKQGFLEKVKGFNIMASGVRNLVTLGKWIADCTKACVDYILPTKKARHLRKLSDMSNHLEMVRVIYLKTKNDMTQLTDAHLTELADVTMELWYHAVMAKNMLKDRQLVHHLTEAYARFTDEARRRKLQGDGLPRVEPIVIWFHGEKGSGKSMASVAAASMICKKLGIDPRKEIYTKPVSAKYYDGYKQQRVMIIDDVGQNTSSTGTDFDDFCQLVSTAPLRLNMAHLEDKGVQFKTPIIIASSNNGDPEPVGIGDTDAIRRRICDHRYLVSAKKDYSRKVDGKFGAPKASVVLDSEKAKHNGVLKTMTCCHFYAGVDPITDKELSLRDIVTACLSALDRKTQVYKSILDMWFDFVEQSGRGVDQAKSHSERALKDICEVLELSVDTKPKKVVPVWTRVLLGVGIVATMVAGLAGIGVTIWGMSGAPGASRGQGAYNVTPQKPMVVKVPAPVASAEQALNEIVELTRHNLVPVGMRCNERIVYKVQGLFVRGMQLIVPRHFMTLKGKKPLIISSRNAEFEYEHEHLVINELEWAGKETDAVLVTLPSGGVTPYKDISKHFVRADQVPKLEGSTGVLVTNGTYGPTYVPETDLQFFAETTYGIEVTYNPAGVLVGKGATMDGMCGGGLVSALNKLQTPLLGIHVAGNGTHATTQIITQEMLGQHAQASRIIGVGSCDNMGMSTKTQYQLSPLARFFQSGKIPAVLGPSLTAEQDIFAMALTKYNVPLKDCPKDWGLFESSFTHHFMDTYGHTAQRLSIDEAINGIHGLDSINMSTSPGYPWVRFGMKKKDLIKWDGKQWKATTMLEDAVKHHMSEVMEEVDGFDDLTMGISNYDKQAKWNPPIKYITYYKDELRPAEKVRQGKTRVIEAAPLHHVVAFRCLFGPAMALLHNSGIMSGFAPGCDIEMEAKYLYRKMQRYPWLFDADYAGFDGSLQPFVMMSAMRVLGEIARIDPITSQRWARLLIRSDHLFGTSELRVFGSMPSGSPATTIINTISNMMMTYYSIQKVTEVPTHQLFKNNFVLAYGDDILIMSSDPILEKKMGVWAAVQKEVFAATVTSPAKDGPPRATSWDHVVFLKRVFVVRHNDVYACLDKSSIEAMFEWQHSSETFKSRVNSALRFAAMWGREYYEDVCARLSFARIVAGVEYDVVPSFAAMELSYIAKLPYH